MENKELLQMLAMHEDLLNGNIMDGKNYAQMSEAERKELLAFVELAQQVRDALAPVKPSASFKQELELALAEAARRRMHKELRIASLSPRRDVLIGAAVGSAVALAGGVVYLMHTWLRGRSQRVGQVGS
ncbi:MAG: hypothetical protein H5T63_04325 [Chloroflexi bacterium]|nr:hypothetical protein [Chloroflexota bacterium]